MTVEIRAAGAAPGPAGMVADQVRDLNVATLVVEVAEDQMRREKSGSRLLETSETTATCTRTTASPDFTVDIRALSRLYLGGGSARLLKTADLILTGRSEPLDRFGRLPRTDRAPFDFFAF